MFDCISGKTEYTEDEAAAALGISIVELRTLVKTHVINEDLESDIPIQSFRATDLLLLKMLSAPRSAAMSHEIV
jgi:hypothetical protein